MEIDKKDFDEFTETMWERLKKGESEYGNTFMERNLKKEITEELYDVANYAFMFAIKVKNLGKKIEELE